MYQLFVCLVDLFSCLFSIITYRGGHFKHVPNPTQPWLDTNWIIGNKLISSTQQCLLIDTDNPL